MITRRAIKLYQSFGRRIAINVDRTWSNTTIDNLTRTTDKLVKSESNIVADILKNTEITQDHMTPEIKLFLLTPNCPLYHTPYSNLLDENGTFSDPFWSIYWPGGQSLTRFILDEGEKLFKTSKNEDIEVLDLGAGCGASGIASKLVGVKKVIANDIDKVACTAIAMNANLNNVDLEISQENLLHHVPDNLPDIILIGDMLYDEEIANVLIPWLDNALEGGSRIYLGDPGRHGLTNDLQRRLKLLRRYTLPRNVQNENHGFSESNVWEFVR